MAQKRTGTTSQPAFRVEGLDRRVAQRELYAYLAALCHDQQFDVQKSVTLIRILALPERVSIKKAIERLYTMLAVTRARANWGRPWTLRQLERIYFQKPESFIRRVPHPVTAEEIKTWKPRVPPGAGVKAQVWAEARKIADAEIPSS